ncbi:MAG: DEAD/DEAH box helicase [Chitinophagaceae bacterium]|nr:DEAD/DEAH box helicase [Chitinophagaceae bacterium]
MTGPDNHEGPKAFMAAVKVTRKIKHLPTWGSINAIPFLYQYTPLFALRRSPWQRVLIADETGLGKTVEAGILMEELFRSQDPEDMIGDALVIGPASLREEWRTKIERHFGRMVQDLDYKDLVARLTSKKPPSKGGEPIWFLSMDVLRRLLDLNETLIRPENFFDLVIVDEAHHFKNRSSKRRQALERLLGDPFLETSEDAPRPRIPKLVLMTATPLSTDIANLESYFTLMDPGLASLDDLKRQTMAFQAEHGRVVTARKLASLSLKVLNDQEDSATLERLRVLAKSEKVRDILLEGIEDPDAEAALATLQAFAEQPASVGPETLAEALLELDPWCDMVVRNTRRGVGMQDDCRVLVENHEVEVGKEERILLNLVENLTDEHPLALVNYRRQASSSIQAFLHRSAIHRIAGTKEEPDRDLEIEQEENTSAAQESPSNVPDEPLDRVRLHSLEDAKLARLVDSLKTFYGKQKQRGALIFTSFTATGSYLHLRLSHLSKSLNELKGIRIEYLHGGIAPEERARRLDEFRESEDRFLLILTEIGQEGIDLQFATGVFHYDLPWNPMRLVQRNGRVHRIGQESPEVFIHTFLVSHSLDDRIEAAIARRMELVYTTFGDLPDGLFGGDVHQSLKAYLSGEGGFHQLLNFRAKTYQEVEARAHELQAAWSHDTEQIRLHQTQIRQILSDEADACQAWRPLVEDALNGAFGSLERVLRSDVEALLHHSTQTGLGVDAQPVPGQDATWDLRWQNLRFDVETGAFGRDAQRKLATRQSMEAQILADDGEKRRRDLEPFQVLHLAHPLVAKLATVMLGRIEHSAALCASPGVERLCALICVDFEVQLGQVEQRRRDSRWFLMEQGNDDEPWRVHSHRGSAERLEAILRAPANWQGLPTPQATKATWGIREALVTLQRSLKDELIQQRLRQELKRERRQFRQIRKVEHHWRDSLREAEQRVRELAGIQAEYDRMGDGKSPAAVGIRNRLGAERGLVTRYRKSYEIARDKRERIQEHIQALRVNGLPGIRLLIHELTPHAVILIQPEACA